MFHWLLMLKAYRHYIIWGGASLTHRAQVLHTGLSAPVWVEVLCPGRYHVAAETDEDREIVLKGPAPCETFFVKKHCKF